MQPAAPSQPERRGLSAHGFLTLVETHFSILEFFDLERWYVIAGTSITATERLSYLSPRRSPTIEERLLFLLESHEITQEYYAAYKEADLSHSDMWRVLLNRGVSSQGKLIQFTRERDLPYATIRRSVSITQKEWIIEYELGISGISINFLPVRHRLAEVSLNEVESFCQLIRASPLFPFFKRNALKGLRMRQNYAVLVQSCT